MFAFYKPLCCWKMLCICAQFFTKSKRTPWLFIVATILDLFRRKRISLYFWHWLHLQLSSLKKRILYLNLFILLLLAFFERPSSLSITSDISMPASFLSKYEFACGILESIDLCCLALLVVDVLVKVSNELVELWIHFDLTSFFVIKELLDWQKEVVKIALAHCLLRLFVRLNFRLLHIVVFPMQWGFFFITLSFLFLISFFLCELFDFMWIRRWEFVGIWDPFFLYNALHWWKRRSNHSNELCHK